jgi:hypothetical protein
MRIRTKFESDEDRIDYAGNLLDCLGADAIAWALDQLGWAIVRQRGPDYPGHDQRWPMAGRAFPCPEWAKEPKPYRRPLTVIDGGRKDDGKEGG